MSAELIATLVCTLIFGIFMFAGFAWTAHRADTNINALGTRLGTLFDKIDARFDKIDAQLEGLSRDLTDVKVSVARMEGPPRHLQPER